MRWLARASVVGSLLGTLAACDGALLPAERFVDHCADAGCPCQQDSHCRDGLACTDDRCQDGSCTFAAVVDSTACDDDDGCTVQDACQAGTCVGQARDCDDGDPCTVGDRCDAGACVVGTSRPLFKLTLPLVGDDRTYGVAPAPDAGAYVAGFSIPKPQDFRARIARLTAAGTVTWDKLYASGVSAQIYGAAADGAGGVVVAGTWWVDKPPATLENWRPFVMRVAPDGTELWKQVDAKGGKIQPITVLANGDVIALGYEQFEWPSRPLAWRLNRESGVEIERVLLGEGYGRLYGVAAMAGGSLIGCGRLGAEGPGSEAVLLRFEGGVLSQVAKGGSPGVDDALRACAAGGGDVVVGVGAAQASGTSRPLLVRWSGGGEPVVGEVPPPVTGRAAGLEGLAALPGGGFVGGGAAVVNGVDQGWWLVGLDGEGQRLWSVPGPSGLQGTVDVLRACATMTDGAVVCVGEQAEANASASHDVVVIRVDADGHTACK